ncbi:NAD(P)-binding protein [Martensiomyces pterosporus]|nr:NAD(P)-binding protein [Martensiomyces pterosporus]
MADNRLVAVVTGANKGIGKAIARRLLLQSIKPIIVYLTARNIDRGQVAFDEIKREQMRVQPHSENELRFHQLDVSDLDSIHTFIDYLTLMHGEESVDILINNAGGVVRSANGASQGANAAVVRTCDADTAYKIVHLNYYTAVNTTSLMLPHMRPRGRVVFMVTALAHLGIFSGDLAKVLVSDDLHLNGLHIIENGFISSVGKGTFSNYGFPPMPFAVAKAGLIAYARMLARIFQSDSRELVFAAVCPGYVKTDMTGPYAPLSPDQGAETPAYVALADDKRLKKHNGGLWKHMKPIKW